MDVAQDPDGRAIPVVDRQEASPHRLILTELVLPGQANHYGTLFGPYGLALLGKAAYLVATRLTRQSVVMAAAESIEFLTPVPVGALLRIDARVTRIGRSSMTVRVSARLDSDTDAEGDEALCGRFEMVAIDARGRPTAVLTPAAAL